MLFTKNTSPQRWLVPEVIQTSGMDCGPASLKCLLEGFGIPVSYGRLREACQTDVDGTSIDTLEDVANQLGLDAAQVMLPADHLLRPEASALPALVVIRLPNGLTHFVVVWRRLGRWVQIMDPGIGRQWIPIKRFMNELYIHTMPVPASAWYEWAASPAFLDVLKNRLADLRLNTGTIKQLIDQTVATRSWVTLAALDAAARMVTAIVDAGGLRRGQQAATAVGRFTQQAQDRPGSIPAIYWSVQPANNIESSEEHLLLKGAVLIQVSGLHQEEQDTSSESNTKPNDQLPPDLIAALEEPAAQPLRQLFTFLRADGLLTPLVLLISLFLAAGTLLIEALLFRGLFDISTMLTSGQQRLNMILIMALLITLLLLMRLQITSSLLRLGRGLETRLRIAFLSKIPRLHDRYFQSRLMSDMAERSHSVHNLRGLPMLAAAFLQETFTLILTVGGIIWLDPDSIYLAILSGTVLLILPLLAQAPLNEQDLRVRTHRAALGRFYLDSLLGLVPIRVHGAERAVRREHESLLVDWRRASLSFLNTSLWVEAVQLIVGFGLAAWLLFHHLLGGGGAGSVLLLVYWALQLPMLGQHIALLARQYPGQRNITLRLFEPLGAPETADLAPESLDITAHIGRSKGTEITLRGLTVRAAGHTILEDIDLDIASGSHIAIVGPSGAGKSSLAGLLLGWHRPAAGQLLVDSQPFTNGRLQELRQQTAWVDPAVQLWNRSLLDNLSYGQTIIPSLPIGTVIKQADLINVLEKLPSGLQHPLGEGGALLSGGEGQRVRLGRAMLNPNARLVILDEPFRGLDRAKRRHLMTRVRDYWPEATILCITHDVSQTQQFERVLVVENGRLVEDGRPAELAAQPASRYHALLTAEEAVRTGLWASAEWRRLQLANGRITESQTDFISPDTPPDTPHLTPETLTEIA